jgi:hypothetical protein
VHVTSAKSLLVRIREDLHAGHETVYSIVNRLFEKNSENVFSQKNCIEKLMVPSESAPQELSNEWSCQYISTILIFLAISLVTYPW